MRAGTLVGAALAVLASAMWVPSPAQAAPFSGTLIAESLASWDVPRAAKLLDRLEPEERQLAEMKVLEGRLELLRGNYAKAADLLQEVVSSGSGGMARHFLEIASNTERETRDYKHHLTASGHFQISYAPGPDEILIPYAEQALEASWDRLTKLLDHEPPSPVRIEFYPRVDVLGAVSSLTVDEIKTSGTIALCKYNRLMVVSPRALAYGYEWTDTIAHEFIHLLITQKTRNQVPIWLHEGLAKYFESRWRSDRRPKLGRHSEDLLAKALFNDELISFEDMSPSMAKLPSQKATATAFAEVFTVIEYLISRRGDAAARELLELLRDGRSDRESVASVAGTSWARFQPTWRRYLKNKGLKRMDDVFDQRLLFKGEDAETEALQQLKADKARNFTWLGDRLRLKKRYKAAAKEYAKAAEVVGPLVPLIQQKIGFVLLRRGDPEAAIAAMLPPLDVYPGHVLLHVYLGEAYLAIGEVAKAREHLEHGAQINPFDPDLHGHLATVYDKLGEEALAKRARRFLRLARGL